MISSKQYKTIFAFFMALFMSGIMSFVICVFNVGLVKNIFTIWLEAWSFAFVVAFPTVIIVFPIVHKLVLFVIYEKKIIPNRLINNNLNGFSMNKFKILSMFTSLLCFYLFYLLFFSAHSFMNDLGIEGTEAAYFISRRAAVLMLGISVLMFFVRNVPNCQARQAISLSISITMLGLALSGIYELNRRFVGNNILSAILIESALCISFFYVWFSSRVESKNTEKTNNGSLGDLFK